MAVAVNSIEREILAVLSKESMEPVELFHRLRHIGESETRRAVIQLLAHNKIELDWDRKLVKK